MPVRGCGGGGPSERERKRDRERMPLQGCLGSASLSLSLKICRGGGPIHIYIYRSISTYLCIYMYISTCTHTQKRTQTQIQGMPLRGCGGGGPRAHPYAHSSAPGLRLVCAKKNKCECTGGVNRALYARWQVSLVGGIRRLFETCAFTFFSPLLRTSEVDESWALLTRHAACCMGGHIFTLTYF